MAAPVGLHRKKAGSLRRRYSLAFLLFAGGCTSSALKLEDDGPGAVGGPDLGTGVDFATGVDLATGIDLASNETFVPAPCGPATPVFAGSLCGPASPCVLHQDEVVAANSPPGSLNDGPAVAVDAAGRVMTLVPTATSGTNGTIASREVDGTWTSASLPWPTLAASLIAHNGALYATLYDGAFGVTWAEWKDRAWKMSGKIPGELIAFNHSMAADDSGCFFLSATDGDSNLRLGRRSGDTWTTGLALATPGASASTPQVALSPQGRLHVVANLSFPDGGGGPSWVAPPLARESLPTTTPTSYGERLLIGVTDDGPLGRAHVLYNSNDTLRYATRPASGGWSGVVVAANTLQSCPSFLHAGDTCTTDEVRFIPVAVLTSGAGDVRLVYLRDETVRQWIAACSGSAPPMCSWSETASAETTQVTLGWPAGAGVSSTVLATLPGGALGDATVDATGTIHIVVRENKTGGVRYLSFSP